MAKEIYIIKNCDEFTKAKDFILFCENKYDTNTLTAINFFRVREFFIKFRVVMVFNSKKITAEKLKNDLKDFEPFELFFDTSFNLDEFINETMKFSDRAILGNAGEIIKQLDSA